MDEREWLAERFEEHRAHLRAVAYRMLGSPSEADDAVQEAWLRLSRSDTSRVENLGGWLTTVIARVCLNTLRSRKSRREEPLDDEAVGPVAGPDPEHEALLADSVGLALLVVLETLTPAERVAFVLHDMFDLPFDEIADVIERSPAATQLASRARRRVQGATPVASRGGDFGALIAMLDPDVVLRADDEAVRIGASREVLGASAVAGTFSGRARFARPALVEGAAGAVWWGAEGRPRVVFRFTIVDGRISRIDLVADPAQLDRLDPRALDD